MATVNVSQLRDIATRMINDGEEGKAFDAIKANEQYNNLRDEWEKDVAPELRKAASLFVMALDADADPGVEKEMLKQVGLTSEAYRHRSDDFEDWLFGPWAQREKDVNLKHLLDTMNGVRVSAKYADLMSRGRALHTLLAPIESETITTSFLERSGFAGSWVTHDGK